MALITATEYKTARGISGSTWDARITPAILHAKAWTDRYCGREDMETGGTSAFELDAAEVEVVDGTGSEWLFVKRTPLNSITSIVETYTDGSTATVTSTSYRKAHANQGAIVLLPAMAGWESSPSRSVWTEGVQNFTVTYSGGYTTIPDDLKNAQYEIIDVLLAQAPGSPGGGAFQSENLGDYSYSRFTHDERFALVRAILQPFRRAIP